MAAHAGAGRSRSSCRGRRRRTADRWSARPAPAPTDDPCARPAGGARRPPAWPARRHPYAAGPRPAPGPVERSTSRIRASSSSVRRDAYSPSASSIRPNPSARSPRAKPAHSRAITTLAGVRRAPWRGPRADGPRPRRRGGPPGRPGRPATSPPLWSDRVPRPGPRPRCSRSRRPPTGRWWPRRGPGGRAGAAGLRPRCPRGPPRRRGAAGGKHPSCKATLRYRRRAALRGEGLRCEPFEAAPEIVEQMDLLLPSVLQGQPCNTGYGRDDDDHQINQLAYSLPGAGPITSAALGAPPPFGYPH